MLVSYGNSDNRVEYSFISTMLSLRYHMQLLMFLILFIDLNKRKMLDQGLNRKIISSNNAHHREALLIIHRLQSLM